MRVCQYASRLALRTALLGGVALWLLLFDSPASAGPFTFPMDFYLQASVGDQNTPNFVLTGGSAALMANGPDQVTGQGSQPGGRGSGDALAIADYGLLKAKSNALTATISNLGPEMEISASAIFRDSWLVTSSTLPVGTHVTVPLTALLSASILLSGGTPTDSCCITNAHLNVRTGSNIFCGTCPPDLLLNDTLDVGQPFTAIQTLMVPSEVGGSLTALVELDVQAINIPPAQSGTGATLVDASNSGTIFLNPPPGVVLISGSGHDYSTSAPPPCGVPGAPPCSASEPSSFLLLSSGVAGLAGVTWRRHRHK